MARKVKVESVYKRIADKNQEIIAAKAALAQLEVELNELEEEKDNLEMKQLFVAMKEKGLSVNEAIQKIQEEKEEKEIVDGITVPGTIIKKYR